MPSEDVEIHYTRDTVSRRDYGERGTGALPGIRAGGAPLHWTRRTREDGLPCAWIPPAFGCPEQSTSARSAPQQAVAPHRRQLRSPHVIDVTEDTFQTEVVERSRTVPCGPRLLGLLVRPVQQLSPVLERLAAPIVVPGFWPRSTATPTHDCPRPPVYRAFRLSRPSWTVRSCPSSPGRCPNSRCAPGWTSCWPPYVSVTKPLGTAGPWAGGGAWWARRARWRAATGAGRSRPRPRRRGARRRRPRGLRRAFRAKLDKVPGDPDATVGLARVELLQRASAIDQAALQTRSEREPARRYGAAASLLIYRSPPAAPSPPSQGWSSWSRKRRATSGRQVRTHLLELFAALGEHDPSVAPARKALARALF